jgi:hypothetical protein
MGYSAKTIYDIPLSQIPFEETPTRISTISSCSSSQFLKPAPVWSLLGALESVFFGPQTPARPLDSRGLSFGGFVFGRLVFGRFVFGRFVFGGLVFAGLFFAGLTFGSPPIDTFSFLSLVKIDLIVGVGTSGVTGVNGPLLCLPRLPDPVSIHSPPSFLAFSISRSRSSFRRASSSRSLAAFSRYSRRRRSSRRRASAACLALAAASLVSTSAWLARARASLSARTSLLMHGQQGKWLGRISGSSEMSGHMVLARRPDLHMSR